MGTVRVERCPDCLAMVGEGHLYEHQRTCPERKQPASEWTAQQVAGAILHRTNQMPKAVGYISIPRDWCERVIELLLKGDK